MRIQIVTQPDAGTSNLHEFLVALLDDPDISRVVAVTAWVNHRGLSRLVPKLRNFRTRGVAEIILGIDEGGATEQGLRLAATEFDRASVFFTTEERTFHPKVYLGTGAAKALLFIGSNNLTPGGLFFNFEVALALDMDLGPGGLTEDRDLTTAVEMYITRLQGDADVCKPLGANLEDIIRDGTYRVRNEADPRRRQGTSVIDPDADREAFPRSALFGRSSEELKGRVPPGEPIPPSTLAGAALGPARSPRPAGTTVAPVTAPVAGGGGPAVVRRWFRPLDNTAAQHPPIRPAAQPATFGLPRRDEQGASTRPPTSEPISLLAARGPRRSNREARSRGPWSRWRSSSMGAASARASSR